MITFCRCGQRALSPEQQWCWSEWLRWGNNCNTNSLEYLKFSRNSVTLHAFECHTDADNCFASSQTQAQVIFHSLNHAVILRRASRSQLRPSPTDIHLRCGKRWQGPAERTTKEARSRSGHVWEVPWVGFNRIWRKERLRHLLPSFEGETGMVDISASKPDKCTADEMVLPFLQGTGVDHRCVRVSPCLPPVWCLLDRLSWHSALMSRTWHSHLPFCVKSYCARPCVTWLQCDLWPHRLQSHTTFSWPLPLKYYAWSSQAITFPCIYAQIYIHKYTKNTELHKPYTTQSRIIVIS